MQNIVQTAFNIVFVFMVFDLIFFLWWYISGQTPMDSFYFGTVSAHIIDVLWIG